MTRGSRGRIGWALAVAVIFTAVTYVSLRDASVVTPPQGREYVRAAASLAGGAGFATGPDEYLTRFAPLYPVLLAPLALAGMDVVPAVYLLNCLALTLGLLGFYWLAREMNLRGAGAASIVFGLWAVHYYLLRAIRPDGLAVGLTLLTLAALLHYGRRHDVGSLVWLAVLGGLAASCRYMTALTLLPALVIGVAVLSEGRAKVRWLRGVIVGLTAALPISIWILRNLTLTGHLLGMSRTAPRPMAEGSDLWTNAYRLGKTVLIDLFSADSLGTFPVVFGELAPSRPGWIIGAALVVAAAVCFAVVRSPRARLGMFRRGREAVGILLYPAVYVVLLLTLWTLGNNDPIHTRFVAPVYPFLALAGLALASRAASDRPALVALGLAAALVLTPSTIKCVGLLGERPTQNLLELQGRKKTRDRWHSDVPWDVGRKWLDQSR